MKTSTCLGVIALVATGSLLGALATACDDDDGVGPASTLDSGQPETGGQNDAAACVDEVETCGHCASGLAFKPECSLRKACCANNVAGTGKSSAEIANAMQSCICLEQCATECQSSCGGNFSQPTPACLSCAFEKCLPAITECQLDVETHNLACNPGGGGSDGGTDAGDGGTDDAGPEAGTGG